MPVTLLRMVVKIFLRSKYTESNKKWLIPAKTCSRKTFAVIATTPKMVHSCLVNHINKFYQRIINQLLWLSQTLQLFILFFNNKFFQIKEL